jgi:hypothetical protein
LQSVPVTGLASSFLKFQIVISNGVVWDRIPSGQYVAKNNHATDTQWEGMGKNRKTLKSVGGCNF